jgi:hypothetical protein
MSRGLPGVALGDQTVRNLFNQHYYTFGTFFQTDSFPYLNLTDPRTFVPGAPLTAMPVCARDGSEQHTPRGGARRAVVRGLSARGLSVAFGVVRFS